MSRRRVRGPSLSFFAFQDIITSVVGIILLITLIMIIDLVSQRSRLSTPTASSPIIPQDIINELKAGNALLQTRLDELIEISELKQDEAVLSPNELKAALRNNLLAMQTELESLEASIPKLQDQLEKGREEWKRLKTWDQQRNAMQRDLDSTKARIESLASRRATLLTNELLIFRKTELGGRSVFIIDIHPKEFHILDIDASKRMVLERVNLNTALLEWIKMLDLAKTHLVFLIRPDGVEGFGALQEFLTLRGASFGFDVIGKDATIRLTDELEDQIR